MAGSGRGTPIASHSSFRKDWELLRSLLALSRQRAMKASIGAALKESGTWVSYSRLGASGHAFTGEERVDDRSRMARPLP